MIRTTRRNLSIYAALFAMIPKLFMAYQIWFWIGLVLNVLHAASGCLDHLVMRARPFLHEPVAEQDCRIVN